MNNQTLVITIEKIETKMFETGTQYRITADRKIFKFYDKKKDGTNTVAFQQFQDMGIKPGSTVEVWYKEEEKVYEGKSYTDRIIASFREATAKPIQNTTSTPKAPVMSNSGVTEASYKPTEYKDEKFWEDKALKQCIWGYWLERKSTSVPTQEEMVLVANTFETIEKFVKNRNITNEFETRDASDVSVEDISF